MSTVAGLYRSSRPLSSKEREHEFNEKLRQSGLGGSLDKKDKDVKKKQKEETVKEKKKKIKNTFDFAKVSASMQIGSHGCVFDRL